MRRLPVLLGALAAALASLGAAPAPSAALPSAPAGTARIVLEPAPPGRLPWVVFDERSGLPQHTIVDMIEDQEGYVWAATHDGPARYDGHTWQPFSLPKSMNTNYPRAMKVARNGGIWMGSFDGGLALLRDGAWTITDKDSGLRSNRIRGLLETTGAGGAVLWIATDRGVARLQDGRVSTYGKEAGLPDEDTEALGEVTGANGERTLLVGTSQGLARLEGGRFVRVPVPQQILGNRINDIVESAGLQGGPALWIASYGGGMAVQENGAWTVLDKSSGLPSNVEVITRSRARDGSPALWIGTEGGLVRFEHGRFTLYDERCGLPIRIVWKVLETGTGDGPGTVWLGTWGGGVVRLAPEVWTAFDAAHGLPSGSLTSITETTERDGRETIWAGTSDGELARFDGARFQRVELPEPLRHAIIFHLLGTRDDDGGSSLWVASFGGGLGRLKSGRWTLYDPKVLPNARVYTVRETKADDSASVLWLGTEGGLGRLERGKWTVFRKADDELPSEIVTQVVETRGPDGARSIWASTAGGIARLEGGRWTVAGKKAGLESENVVCLEAVTDAEGVRWLWAGTFAGGASRRRVDDPAGRWETFTTATTPALPSDTVMGIATDRQHRIYLFTTHGVARLTPRGPTADDPKHFLIDTFTADDGLPSGDCQQAARFVDGKGRVWVGTARGLGMFDPERGAADRGPKRVVIEGGGIASGSRRVRAHDSLSHAQRNLRFDYALLSWVGEPHIRYRYQLLGFDPEPSSWTASASKEYTNLGAGDYVFRVWGRDAHGHASSPADLPFRIRPAPWLTVWALIGYVMVGGAIVYGAVQWRVRTLSVRARELEAIVAERTRELAASRDMLAQLAAEDPLTGVANRRRFDAVLEQEWKRAQRGEEWLSLVLLDVDFFKRFNDRYGHARGDACLRAVAQAVASCCRRPTDLVARFGGEEFALVLPETDPDGVRALLRAVLEAVDSLRIDHAGSTCARHVTISVGAASTKPPADANRLSLVERADRLLYLAKDGGRHQAVLDEGSGKAERVLPADGSAVAEDRS
jgi:diguanylate cyclase (GGDEF)-like protein